MRIALLFPLIALQDSLTLKWGFDRAHKYEILWTVTSKVETFKEGKVLDEQTLETTTEYSTSGSIREITFKNEAKFSLALRRYVSTAKLGKDIVEILVEGGELKKGPEKEKETILKQVAQPIELTLPRSGAVSACKWGAQDRPEGLGFLGGRVPEGGVKPGETWEDTVAFPESFGIKNPIVFKVKFDHIAREQDRECAWLAAEAKSTQEGPRGTATLTLKRETVFDPAGYARRGKEERSLEYVGAGKKGEHTRATWVTSIEVTRQ